jgi:hypothetical protein
MAIAGVDTLGAIPDASGAYKFWGIPANTYTLIFAPDLTTNYMRSTSKNIAVTTGNVTKVDTIRLVQ